MVLWVVAVVPPRPSPGLSLFFRYDTLTNDSIDQGQEMLELWKWGSQQRFFSFSLHLKSIFTSYIFRHQNRADLLNDESLRLGVEKFQKGEWKEEDGEKQIGNPGLKNEEQEFIRSAEDEIKAKAARKAALKRELPDCEVKGSAVKKANLTMTEVQSYTFAHFKENYLEQQINAYV